MDADAAEDDDLDLDALNADESSEEEEGIEDEGAVAVSCLRCNLLFLPFLNTFSQLRPFRAALCQICRDGCMTLHTQPGSRIDV